jgi:hypothetical protein
VLVRVPLSRPLHKSQSTLVILWTLVCPLIALSINSYASVGTTNVELFEYHRSDRGTVVLIDTPGFDDSNKDNSCVLEEIVRMLNIFYAEDYLRIVGILYFQRISDVRMSGSSIKSLRIFEKLCGAECFHKVMVVTTFWSLLQNEQEGLGEEREMALRTDPAFFGTLLDSGAHMQRYMDTHQSARTIVDGFLHRPKTVVLSVQKEMVNDGSILAETAVGQFMISDLSAIRKKYERELNRLKEDYDDAIQGSEDEDIVVSMTEERDRLQERIMQSQLAQEPLYMSYEAMTRKQQDLVFARAHDGLAPTDESYKKTTRELELEEQLERAMKDHLRQMNSFRRDTEAERRDTASEVLRLKEAVEKSRSKVRLIRDAAYDPLRYLGQTGPRRADSAPLDNSKQPTKRRNKTMTWFGVPRLRRPRKPKPGEVHSENEEYYDDTDNAGEADDLEVSVTDHHVKSLVARYPEGTVIAERREPSTTGPVRTPGPVPSLTRSWTGQEHYC